MWGHDHHGQEECIQELSWNDQASMNHAVEGSDWKDYLEHDTAMPNGPQVQPSLTRWQRWCFWCAPHIISSHSPLHMSSG